MEKEERKSKFQLKISKPLLRKTIILLSLILILVFFFLARNYRDFAENYSKTVVRFYSVVFGHISSFFPFSLFEVFVIATIIYAIAWIVFFIRNTRSDSFSIGLCEDNTGDLTSSRAFSMRSISSSDFIFAFRASISA